MIHCSVMNVGDMVGRKRALIACSIGATFGYLLSGFAVAAWMLIASRLVVGAVKFTMVRNKRCAISRVVIH